MPSILFGPDATPERVERGEFFCPECEKQRAYDRTVVRRSLVLFGVRLLPVGRVGEFVECVHCHSTFRPEVLAYDPARAGSEVTAEYRRAIKRVLALMVVTDGAIVEPEIITMQRIFEAVTGRRLSRREAIAEIEEIGRAPVTVARYLATVAGYLNDYGKEQVLRACVLVARADGRVHERESDMIRHLARVVRMEANRAEHLLRAVSESAAPPGHTTTGRGEDDRS